LRQGSTKSRLELGLMKGLLSGGAWSGRDY
jgi:hypothetical protein